MAEEYRHEDVLRLEEDAYWDAADAADAAKALADRNARQVADALDVARVVAVLGPGVDETDALDAAKVAAVMGPRTGDPDGVLDGFPQGDANLQAREYSDSSFTGSEQSNVDDDADGNGWRPHTVLTLASKQLLEPAAKQAARVAAGIPADESSVSSATESESSVSSEDEDAGAAKRQCT